MEGRGDGGLTCLNEPGHLTEVPRVAHLGSVNLAPLRGVHFPSGRSFTSNRIRRSSSPQSARYR